MSDTAQDIAARNRATVETMYGYANAGDTESMLEIWADDITLTEATGHPFPGFWKGKEAVQKATPGVISGLNMTRTEVLEWMAGPHHVCAKIAIHAVDKDGQPFVIDCAELWGLDEDGKINEIRPYYHDMIDLRERLGLAPA
jgi:ketosteroid isomerase-like protein